MNKTFREFLKVKNTRKYRNRFLSHEGCSAMLSVEPLHSLMNMGVITEDEVNEIFSSISLHGVLFNRIKKSQEYKPEQIVQIFGNEYLDYKNFVKAVSNDSMGRFSRELDGRSNIGALLGKSLYNEDTFLKHTLIPNEFNPNNPTVTILCGLPCSGKTTWIKDNIKDEIIISKDAVIEEIARERGINYTECFKIMTKYEHKEAYTETMRRYNDAISRKKSCIIDLTNMSKKSRTKYLHNLKNYNKNAIIFLVGQEELNFRNINRDRLEGKFIPDGVYIQMMKSFMVPTYLEGFSSIKFEH